MAQFVDKAALAAEIERRMKSIRMAFSMQGILHGHDRAYASAQYDAFNSLLSFLDTLEVNEVDAIHPIDDVVSNDLISKELEEEAENYPSIIRTISQQWEAEVESAFIASAKWQKKQTIEKICKWLEDNVNHYAYNKDFVPNAKECFIKMFRRAEI